MHFSLITLEEGREREAARQWVQGAYADHQWLWRLFPAEPGTPRDFLFHRREVHGLPRFYVVSKRPPQAPEPGWQLHSAAYEPKLAPGMRLQFELRANPVVTHSAEGKSVRHDVVMHTKKRLLAERRLLRWQDLPEGDRPALPQLIRSTCAAWLQARAQRLGFAFDADSLLVEGYQQRVEKKGRLRFSTVDFAGVLTVTDAQAFGVALREGIGHAKAFGCGLLLVRPLG